MPDGFMWGVSTSAYQIEGATGEDGRGAVDLGHVRRRAGSHRGRHHRRRRLRPLPPVRRGRRADGRPRRRRVPLLDRPGPASSPTARARPTRPGWTSTTGSWTRCWNAASTPVATLFHWDLPQALQDAGGWLKPGHRRTGFAEYAGLVADALGDRVRLWITLNEPFVHMSLGHALGAHAPGQALLFDAYPVAHHQLLGHGLAVAALRAARRARSRSPTTTPPPARSASSPTDRGRRGGVRRPAQPAVHRSAARPRLPAPARWTSGVVAATATST